MQTAMDRNGNGWIYTVILCCVLFLLCCFCCEECCFCFFFRSMISHTSPIGSHTTDLMSACTSLGVISHMSYSRRTKHHKHKLYQHLYSYNRTSGIIRHALLLRNKGAIEQELHCNSRGATYQALRTQAWQTPIKGMHKAIAKKALLTSKLLLSFTSFLTY